MKKRVRGSFLRFFLRNREGILWTFGIAFSFVVAALPVLVDELKKSDELQDRVLDALQFAGPWVLLFVSSFWLWRFGKFCFQFARRRSWLNRFGVPAETNELTRFSIHELVVQRLRDEGLAFYGFNISDKTTIGDLVLVYTRILYKDEVPKSELVSAVSTARKDAFDRKYGEDRVFDEKLRGLSEFGHWEVHFREYCEKQNIPYTNNENTLDVGTGTGALYSDSALFNELFCSNSGVKAFTDISSRAISLARARLKQRNRKFLVCSAEDLHPRIASNSIDLYTSFRTFSASLFDTRRALFEAKRVMKPGAYLIITIPHLYIHADGTHEFGLMRDVKEGKITKKYRDEVVSEIVDHLKELNFQKVAFEASFPYEVFISAMRSSD